LRFVAAYAAAPPARSSHQGKPEPDLPALLTGLGVGVGVDVPKIITRAVSTRFGVAETKPGMEPTVGVDAGRKNTVCVSVAVGKTKPPLPPCPPLDDGGGLGVFVQTGGTGVLEEVTPGSKVGSVYLLKWAKAYSMEWAYRTASPQAQASQSQSE